MLTIHVHVRSFVFQSNGLSLSSLPSSNGPIDGYSQENSQETSSASLIPPVAMKKKMSAPGTLQPHISVSGALSLEFSLAWLSGRVWFGAEFVPTSICLTCHVKVMAVFKPRWRSWGEPCYKCTKWELYSIISS